MLIKNKYHEQQHTNNMKRILMVLAATVICGACLFTSCKKDEENTPGEGIAMIVKNGQIDYWRQIETAFRSAC